MFWLCVDNFALKKFVPFADWHKIGVKTRWVLHTQLVLDSQVFLFGCFGSGLV